MKIGQLHLPLEPNLMVKKSQSLDLFCALWFANRILSIRGVENNQISSIPMLLCNYLNLFILSEECQEDTKTDTLKRINKSIIKVFPFVLASFRVYFYQHDE